MKKISNVKNWLRGGQIVDHNIRMLRQTAKRVSWATLIISTAYIVIYATINTTANDRKLAINYHYSSLMTYVGIEKGVNRILFNGRHITLKHPRVANSVIFISASKRINNVLLNSFFQSLLLNFFIYILISLYIRKQGKVHQADKFLRGGTLVKNEDFQNSLKRKQINVNLKLGEIPILKNTETIHFEISGATGTGKSQTLKHLIRDIKNRGDRAIIYSTSTEFISEFYDKSKDVILNPLDDRSPNWSIWNEVQEVYHYDDIAASIIPEVEAGANDPFWTDTARSLLSNSARKLQETGEYSTKILFDKLLSISLKEIAKIVKNTAAATIFADGIEKTALSVRSTLLSKLESFKFLTEDRGDFSIREWVKNEDNNGCVFINSIGDQHEVLKPLISCWVDIFASSILSLPEDRKRRVWLIIDELPSLHKLKSLEKILAESRKYGCCVVLSYQSYSKIQSIYGEKGAQTLSDSTASKIFFRSNDQKNAQHSSEQLGKEEVKVTNENLSMGAHIGRDSISISENEKLRELVLPTEILNLGDLHGFYRLPGNYPAVSFKQKFFKAKKIQANGFVASTKDNHIYMLESNVGINNSDGIESSANANLYFFNEATLGDVPDYVKMEIPFDNQHQQYSLNFNAHTPKTKVTSEGEDKIPANDDSKRDANMDFSKANMLRGV
ncbi:type IV conjugative transfer system coupling protein TraD [Bathymodiolus thermophilus thioautotrophic gill symbiont]|uniref:Type IV conjugative transfer system coupling protein TraD n=1 Tax=Bathymodiolus thermophilus thioautotrophic gill symbiont TaxID=2360 RepID=A0A1J5TY16_9GAMM|nr:type IV conjugative transfer system coupling protein TraD [Bathymodiolus thermophilus thioautotrophic gill symbiont]OIR25642.1 type IV conjugative transfer system coupling protein TraD [Bathymodiolus thermophilus thioautotrophic gill symbiont]